jgi:hypothetical protein
MVVTVSDLRGHRNAFRAYSVLYPFVWAVTRLDTLLPWASGYMMVALLTRRRD